LEAGPGRRRWRLRTVRRLHDRRGAVIDLRTAARFPAVVARRPASWLPVMGARRATPYNGGDRRPATLFLMVGTVGDAALASSWFLMAGGRVWWPPAPGGRSGFSDLRHGRRWLADGSWSSEPTLPELSVGDGFGLPRPLPKRRAKAFPAMVSVSTTARVSWSSLEVFCWDASCLVFVFQVKTFLRSSEERRRRHRRCFLLGGVAWKVMRSAPLVVVCLVRRR
jgi:hypothetical protein